MGDDNTVDIRVRPFTSETVGVTVDAMPIAGLGAEFSVEGKRIDVRRPIFEYGVDDPATRRKETRTGTQAYRAWRGDEEASAQRRVG